MWISIVIQSVLPAEKCVRREITQVESHEGYGRKCRDTCAAHVRIFINSVKYFGFFDIITFNRWHLPAMIQNRMFVNGHAMVYFWCATKRRFTVLPSASEEAPVRVGDVDWVFCVVESLWNKGGVIIDFVSYK